MNSGCWRGRRDDAGVTLIELMIYGLLSTLVLAMVGALFASNARVNNVVQSSSQVSGTAQIIADSVTRGVLNADWISTPTTGTSQFVVAHTAGSGASVTWNCQAWFYDTANGGTVYTKISPNRIAAPVSIVGWTRLGSGITKVNGAAIFSGSGGGVTLSMNATAKGTAPVLVATSVTKRQTSATVTTCQ
jgi:Tfp pilus assembly protein PilW